MTAATQPSEVEKVGVSDRVRSGYRPDIQGLRAVAVGLVLAYHAGLPMFPGGYVGVDVFFVISGFLITGLIAREIASTGRLSLRNFYARRARRLLPATAATFLGIATLTLLTLPITRWGSIAGDMVASAFYVVNWRLADRSVDYLGSELAASPLQHFWSLAVEEQFYIVWPLLIVAITWRASGVVLTSRLSRGLLLIAVPSLIWSIYLTRTSPAEAYFLTTTRLWELAIGALAAVHLDQLARIPENIRRLLGWVGLAAIAYASLVFTSATPFPGMAALVPTLGAAAVIVAGSGIGERGLSVLRPRTMQDIGALSYSLYLWHWPVIVAATALWAREDGTLWYPLGAMAAAASVVPAWLTYRLVENPVHKSRKLAAPRRAAVVGAVCLAMGLVAALALHWGLARESERLATGKPLGATALGDEPTSSDAGKPITKAASLHPSILEASKDVADVYGDGCHQGQSEPDVLTCTYGDRKSEVRVALVGDSHAAHWQPALKHLGRQHNWRIETYTKSACLFADVEVWLSTTEAPYADCREWGQKVVQTLTEDPPDIVVVSSSGSYRTVDDGERASSEDSFPVLTQAVGRFWSTLESAGSQVVVIEDTPWWDQDVPECVATNESQLTQCSVDRKEAIERSGSRLHRAAIEYAPDADIANLHDYVCPREECVPVIGNVIVYSDSHHLTATYSRTLAPLLEPYLTKALVRN